jgi:alpha-L-rhamnosidase
VDCPSFRQAQDLSAVLAQARTGAYVFGDVSLLEHAVVQAGQSQAIDGSLHAHPPADDPCARTAEGMFAWVGALWEHYVQTGRRDLLASHQVTLDRLLDFFGRYERLEGLLGGLEGFRAGAREGESNPGDFGAPVNLAYLQALRWAAGIYEVLGAEKESAWASKKSESLARAVEKHFWDAKAKLWRDGFDPVAGTSIDETSVYAHALAVLLRLKPETHAAVARDVILKSMSARRGKTVVPSPGRSGVVLDALVENGLRAEAVELIRTRWGGMLDRGATTFWEQWDGAAGGRCSGAAAVPVQVLAQQVLGVIPVEIGWKRVRVSPLVGDLEFARGTVGSPMGPIRVEWEKVGEDQLAVRVELPEGVEGEFAGPLGESRELESGASEFHT